MPLVGIRQMYLPSSRGASSPCFILIQPTYPSGTRYVTGCRMIDGPIEIAAAVQKVKHQSPVARQVPIPRNRVLPDPPVLKTRPASVGQNNRKERILIPPTPRRCETSTEIHDKCTANNAATAMVENTIPAFVDPLLFEDAALGRGGLSSLQHVRHRTTNQSVSSVTTR